MLLRRWHSCRKNLGNWEVRHIAVDTKLKNRAFYTLKDQAMAAHADSGLVLWDGKSQGSLNNIVELLKRNKESLVYVAPKHTFYPIAIPDDARWLLQQCEQATLENTKDATRLRSSIRDLESMTQTSLNL